MDDGLQLLDIKRKLGNDMHVPRLQPRWKLILMLAMQVSA